METEVCFLKRMLLIPDLCQRVFGALWGCLNLVQDRGVIIYTEVF